MSSADSETWNAQTGLIHASPAEVCVLASHTIHANVQKSGIQTSCGVRASPCTQFMEASGSVDGAQIPPRLGAPGR
jgi:hypothetical protein